MWCLQTSYNYLWSFILFILNVFDAMLNFELVKVPKVTNLQARVVLYERSYYMNFGATPKAVMICNYNILFRVL